MRKPTLHFLLCAILSCACAAWCGDTLTWSLTGYITDVLAKNQDLQQKQFSRDQATAMTWSKIRGKPYMANVAYDDRISNRLSTNVLDKVPVVQQNTNQVSGTVSKTFVTGTQLGVSYGYSFEKSNSEMVPLALRSYHNANVNVNVSQPLLSGLSNILHRRDIVMAKIEESVTSLEYYNTVCATILKAVQSYFALMAEQNQAKLRETSLDYAKKQLATIEALVKKKFENNEKLLQYKAKVLEREIDNYAVQASLQQQLANFLQLVDQMENSQVVRLTTDPMEPVALDRERLPSLLDSSLARRIDFRRAEQNLDRAKLNLTMAQSATLPNLALNGTYYMYGTDPEFGRTFAKIQSQSYNDFKVGMSFSMPIDKDYRRSQLTPLTIAVNDMEFQKKSLARSIRQELQGAVARLELNARQYASTCSAVMVADLNSAEALKLYENGFMRFDDYLDQLKNKEASRNQQLKSRIEYTNSYYSLRQSQGLLLESFSLEIK